MFSQHPFALGHRYALAVRPGLPSWKRVVDLMCCIVLLPLLGVLTFALAVVALLVARGPIFYRQEIVGYLGRRFWIYRFRTMRVVTPVDEARVISTSRTAEATKRTSCVPGGALLRATGLADLPQVVNVLRGEMSIVGPRPCSVCGVAGRAADVDALTAVPGVTGLWRIQTSGEGSRAAVTQWEGTYPETMSFRSDLGLIVRSLLVALRFR